MSSPFRLDWNVQTEQGEHTTLSQALPNKAVLLILLRQSECMECSLLIVELNAIFAELTEWNVETVFIGNQDHEKLARVRQRLHLDADTILLCDPSQQIHDGLNLNRASLGIRGIKSLFKGFINGHMQTSYGQDNDLQSGLFLLDDQHLLCWEHRSEHLGDIPAAADILQAVLELRSGQ